MARPLGLDRKTVWKDLRQSPQGYWRRPGRATKLDAYCSSLRERWQQRGPNAHKRFGEIQKRGYPGGYTQLRRAVAGGREEEAERALVRFETQPGKQSQLDRGPFGNGQGPRLYAFAWTLGYSRMRCVEFTHHPDMETLLPFSGLPFTTWAGAPKCFGPTT